MTSLCSTATDCSDCGPRFMLRPPEDRAAAWGLQTAPPPPPPLPNYLVCSNICNAASGAAAGFVENGECDDGGEGSKTQLCMYGADCADCGPRLPAPFPPPISSPPPPPLLCGGSCGGTFSDGDVFIIAENPCWQRCAMAEDGLKWLSLGYGMVVDGIQTSCVCPSTESKVQRRAKDKGLAGDVSSSCELESVVDQGLQLCCNTTCYKDSGWKQLSPPPTPPLWTMDPKVMPKPPAAPHPPPCPVSVCGKLGYVETNLGGATSAPIMVSKAACARGCANSLHYRDMSCIYHDLNGDGHIDFNDCMSRASHLDFCSCCNGPPPPPPPPPVTWEQLANVGTVVDAICNSQDTYASYSSSARRLAARLGDGKNGLLTKGWRSAGNGSWYTNTVWNVSVRSDDALEVEAGWRVSAGRFITGHHRPGSLGLLTVSEARLACARDPGCVGFSYERAHWLRNRSARMQTILVGIHNGQGLTPLDATIYRRQPRKPEEVQTGEVQTSEVRMTPQDPDAEVMELSAIDPWDWLDGRLSWTTHFNPSHFSPTAWEGKGERVHNHLWPHQEVIGHFPDLEEELMRALHPLALRATTDSTFFGQLVQNLKEIFAGVHEEEVLAVVTSMISAGMRGHRRRDEELVFAGGPTSTPCSEPSEITDALCAASKVTRACFEASSSASLSATCGNVLLQDLVKQLSGAAIGSDAFDCMSGGKCPENTSPALQGVEYCQSLYGDGPGVRTLGE